MPYIKTTVNRPIPPDTREQLKAALGQAVGALGKPESYLMVEFCENSPLYFAGTAEPAALVSVDLFGSAGAAAYAEFTEKATALVGGALDICAGRIFVKYAEYAHWGMGGRNF